jgi:hypothetical protein
VASPWDIDIGPHRGRRMTLVTPEEFKALPNGTVLVCINGDEFIKGRDTIDQDTRFGHLAFGVLHDPHARDANGNLIGAR